jgi:hypothetical protein
VAAAGDLVLSGGGSVAVGTDALFSTVAELRRFAGHVDATATRIAILGLDDGVRCLGPRDDGDLARAAASLGTAAVRADELALALQRAAEHYGELERRTTQLWRRAEGWAAERAGAWLSLLLPLLPAASAAVAGLLLGAAGSPGGVQGAGRSTAEALGPASRTLTDPRTVTLLRSLVLAGDDAVAGMLRAPSGTAALLGEQGFGIGGLPGFAAILVALTTRYGAAREGDVRVRRARRTSPGSAPRGFLDRVDRVPTGPSQIRIERYTFPTGGDRFQVFLGGTRTAGILGGDEAWDMTSNLHAVADLSPASVRAAEDAMRQAGVTAEDEVVFTGYSQGGLVATRLAAAGDWNTQGLVTFGAPVAGIHLPGTFPAVQLEHTDDLVPAFGGDRSDLGPIVVRREAFAGREVPAEIAVPAHRLAEYRVTAELLDAARSPAIVSAAGRLEAFGRGAERVEVTLYRADRVPKG